MASTMTRWVRITLAAVALAAITGCSSNRGDSGEPLLNIRSSGIPPDEFLVQPQNPLQAPENPGLLPTPNLGGRNLADIDASGGAIAALGGSIAPRSGRLSAQDQALVAAARSNGGQTPGIREILRREDQAFRQDQARRLARRAEDLQAGSIYRFMRLDPFDETVRLRGLGIRVPASPPPPPLFPQPFK